METSNNEEARALVAACMELQSAADYLVKDGSVRIPPPFCISIPGEPHPLLASLFRDDRGKVGINFQRNYRFIIDGEVLDEEDPLCELSFLGFSMADRGSLPMDSLRWYGLIGEPLDGATYPDLIVSDRGEDARSPRGSEITSMLFGIRGVMEACRRGLFSEYEEDMPLNLLVSGTIESPLVGFAKLQSIHGEPCRVEPIPHLALEIRDMPLTDETWTFAVRRKPLGDGEGKEDVMVVVTGEEDPKGHSITLESGDISGLWRGFQKALTAGIGGGRGIPDKMNIKHGGLARMADLLLSPRGVTVSMKDERGPVLSAVINAIKDR